MPAYTTNLVFKKVTEGDGERVYTHMPAYIIGRTSNPCPDGTGLSYKIFAELGNETLLLCNKEGYIGLNDYTNSLYLALGIIFIIFLFALLLRTVWISYNRGYCCYYGSCCKKSDRGNRSEEGITLVVQQ